MSLIEELAGAYDRLEEGRGKPLSRAVDDAERILRLAQKALTDYRRASFHVWGIRHGTDVPAIMSSAELHHWMFVRSFTAGEGGGGNTPRIETLECFVIPELICPQSRQELPPGKTSGTVESIRYDGRRLADEMIDKLTGVAEGGEEDVILRPCPRCGMQSPLVCHYEYDGEYDHIGVELFVLCHRCPSADRIASRSADRRRWDAPFLQPKKG